MCRPQGVALQHTWLTCAWQIGSADPVTQCRVSLESVVRWRSVELQLTAFVRRSTDACPRKGLSEHP